MELAKRLVQSNGWILFTNYVWQLKLIINYDKKKVKESNWESNGDIYLLTLEIEGFNILPFSKSLWLPPSSMYTMFAFRNPFAS